MQEPVSVASARIVLAVIQQNCTNSCWRIVPYIELSPVKLHHLLNYSAKRKGFENFVLKVSL